MNKLVWTIWSREILRQASTTYFYVFHGWRHGNPLKGSAFTELLGEAKDCSGLCSFKKNREVLLFPAVRQGTREMPRWTPRPCRTHLVSDMSLNILDKFQNMGRIDLNKVIASWPRPGWGSWKKETTPHKRRGIFLPSYTDQNSSNLSQKKTKWLSSSDHCA